MVPDLTDPLHSRTVPVVGLFEPWRLQEQLAWAQAQTQVLESEERWRASTLWELAGASSIFQLVLVLIVLRAAFVTRA